jgi:signal transduction histidine kinase
MRNFLQKKWTTVLALALSLVFLALIVVSSAVIHYGRSDGWYYLDTESFVDTKGCQEYAENCLSFVGQYIQWTQNAWADYLSSYGGAAFSYVVTDNAGRTTVDMRTPNSVLVPITPYFISDVATGIESYTVQGYVNLPVEPYQGCYGEYWLFTNLFPLRYALVVILVLAVLGAALCLVGACLGRVWRTKTGVLLRRGSLLPVDAVLIVTVVLTALFCSRLDTWIYRILYAYVGSVYTNGSYYQQLLGYLIQGCRVGTWCVTLGGVVYYSLGQLASHQLAQRLLMQRLNTLSVVTIAVIGHFVLLARTMYWVYYEIPWGYDMSWGTYSRPILLVYDLVFSILLLYYFLGERRILAAAERLADGDLEHKVELSRLHLTWRQLGHALNCIGDGMAQAVEKQLHSERMKTELITNVSHDLKTPLTSLISYVDLLKTPGLDEQTRNQYLEVLDRQSQKLKKLTCDVVEASKAASGVMQVELEQLDAGELLEQSVGEHSVRLRAAGIEPIVHTPPEQILLIADGALLGRVLENLLTNVTKYAQPGTRAYFDLEQRAGQVVITAKNISSAPLNISSTELMERFVRGDSSRHSEGSGLGLSIAQSLTELMGGTLDIILDGDLFKAVITFPQTEELIAADI